ncbi:hypothetical protein [Pseudonocardia pini]|uniref:hypothetical protein n=1 Tax=Pseudonocardia pini TaxID=2758030 RepID=UPI0015F02EE6|nr:hypothetical protein [Pseudonocardia pini]
MTAEDLVADFVQISRQCAEPASPAGAFWAHYDALIAELDRRGERIAAALALHQRQDDWCTDCGFEWPCRTVRALTEGTT